MASRQVDEFKKQNVEMFREIRSMLSMFGDIVDHTPIVEDENVEDITFLVYKIKKLERKFAYKKIDKFATRRYMKKERMNVAHWMAYALQDLYCYNKDNPQVAKKIEKLHSLCFNAFEEFRGYHFPMLENRSGSSGSSNDDSGVEDSDLEDGEIRDK